MEALLVCPPSLCILCSNQPSQMMKIVQRLGITNIVASRMTTIAISITIAITLNVWLVAITLSLPSTSLSPTN